MPHTTPQDDKSLDIPSFLMKPTRRVHADAKEDEVEAVMESVRKSASRPQPETVSEPKPRKGPRKQTRKKRRSDTGAKTGAKKPTTNRATSAGHSSASEPVGAAARKAARRASAPEPAGAAARKAARRASAPVPHDAANEPDASVPEVTASESSIDVELSTNTASLVPEATAAEPDGAQASTSSTSFAAETRPNSAAAEATISDVASVLASAVMSFDAPVVTADEDVELLPSDPTSTPSSEDALAAADNTFSARDDAAATANGAAPVANGAAASPSGPSAETPSDPEGSEPPMPGNAPAPAQQSAPQDPAENAPAPSLEEDLHTLAEVERRLFAHRYATAEIETFGECIDPPKATADRAEVLAVLVEEDHELLSKPEVDGALKRLSARSNELEPLVAKQVEVLVRDRQRIVGVPASLQAKLVRLQAESYDAWLMAKANDDWRSFAPYLDRLVNLQRKVAVGMNPDADPYDTMLDMYEKGTNRAFYNNFFARVKQCVVPLLSSISMSGRTLSRSCVEGHFDEARQWELAQDVAHLEGIDEGAHYLTSTEHPFSQSMTSNYVVTANRVDPNDLMSGIYSMLHEVGHNLYEQGINPDLNRTSLAGGTSMGMHEAQSRFFENYIGRDRAFVPVLLALIKNRFPGQLGRVTPNQLYRAINRVAPSLIRMDADELTYPMHILVRYEIEQLLMAGKATATEVPKLWADRYSHYIGANVRNHREGPLQDVHWAQGCFGYFPTYALGNAYAAQLRAKMIEEGLNWDAALSSGDLSPIRRWLRERVWQYGRSKDPADIIKDATGEPFNPRHYANYLTHKYADLYGLR